MSDNKGSPDQKDNKKDGSHQVNKDAPNAGHSAIGTTDSRQGHAVSGGSLAHLFPKRKSGAEKQGGHPVVPQGAHARGSAPGHSPPRNPHPLAGGHSLPTGTLIIKILNFNWQNFKF